jgi:hypothetical protein
MDYLTKGTTLQVHKDRSIHNKKFEVLNCVLGYESLVNTLPYFILFYFILLFSTPAAFLKES